MSANITIDEDVLTDFETMRTKKGHRYSVYQVMPDENGGSKKICKENVVMGNEPTDPDDLETILEEEMPADACRFVMLDFRYLNAHDSQIDKFVLFIWCPAGCSTQEQDMYYACRNVFRQKMVGIAKEYIVNYPDDVSYSQIKEEVAE